MPATVPLNGFFTYLREKARSAQEAIAPLPPSGWTPADLGASLLGWWDAEDEATLTLNGAQVTAWSDKVAGLSLSQVTGTFKPLWAADSMNNRPAMTFDGSDDFLALTPHPFPAGSEPSELWSLVSQLLGTGSATTRTIVGYGAGTSARNTRRLNRIVNVVNRASMGVGDGTNELTTSNSTVEYNGPHVVRGRVTSTEAALNIDDAPTNTIAVVPNTVGTTMRVGCASHTLSSFMGMAANTVIVTAPLSDDQALNLKNFLKTRGGIV